MDQHNNDHDISVHEAMVAVYGDAAEGLEPEVVFRKELMKSDVHPHFNCLMIPAMQARRNLLLTRDEVMSFRLQQPSFEVVRATLVDFKGNTYSVGVRMQKVGKVGFYTITKPWNEIVFNTGLQKGSRVELWAFRRPGSVLGFFVDKI